MAITKSLAMTATLATYAESLLNSDWSVVPTKEDKKANLIQWKEYQAVLMTTEEAAKAFTHPETYGIAIIMGQVSGNAECIDFDAHEKDIETIFKEWGSDQGVKDIIKRNKIYVERSPRGGYHVIYRYEPDGTPEGSQKLANWENGESMIETKGERGYIIVAPTPGYKRIHGSLDKVGTITQEERDYLIEKAITFNQHKATRTGAPSTGGNGADADPVKGHHYTDPISWFNWNKAAYAKQLLEDNGWAKVTTDERTDIEQWRRPGKTDGTSATWGAKHNALYVFSSSVNEFPPECYYTPFQILVILRFKGSDAAAVNWIRSKYFSDEVPYVRVGVDYYKKIIKKDRYGIPRTELKPWKKDEIKQDHGRGYLERIPCFDDFTIVPNNINYSPVVDNCYNLYKEFAHKPAPGKWPWIKVMLEHAFGDQYDLAIRYLQALYLHPDRMLPIVVVVSTIRQTGKTTLLNWLNAVFGDNMVNIAPEDLTGSFNHIYATSNIIAIEETLIEKSITVEKLKALATGKFISVNQKHVSQYKVPFFGKIILASNNEDKFARIDEEETRFWVRKLTIPKITNHNIEQDMIREIPAFLHYLTTLPPIDWSKDRSGFTAEELDNDNLKAVKKESKAGLYKELVEYITDWFLNCDAKELNVIPKDIKEKWFTYNHNWDATYIRRVLKQDFKMEPIDSSDKYKPFDDGELIAVSRSGRFYTFKREDFVSPVSEIKKVPQPQPQKPIQIEFTEPNITDEDDDFSPDTHQSPF